MLLRLCRAPPSSPSLSCFSWASPTLPHHHRLTRSLPVIPTTPPTTLSLRLLRPFPPQRCFSSSSYPAEKGKEGESEPEPEPEQRERRKYARLPLLTEVGQKAKEEREEEEEDNRTFFEKFYPVEIFPVDYYVLGYIVLTVACTVAVWWLKKQEGEEYAVMQQFIKDHAELTVNNLNKYRFWTIPLATLSNHGSIQSLYNYAIILAMFASNLCNSVGRRTVALTFVGGQLLAALSGYFVESEQLYQLERIREMWSRYPGADAVDNLGYDRAAIEVEKKLFFVEKRQGHVSEEAYATMMMDALAMTQAEVVDEREQLYLNRKFILSLPYFSLAFMFFFLQPRAKFPPLAGFEKFVMPTATSIIACLIQEIRWLDDRFLPEVIQASFFSIGYSFFIYMQVRDRAKIMHSVVKKVTNVVQEGVKLKLAKPAQGDLGGMMKRNARYRLKKRRQQESQQSG
eukprot:TRINITY_DN1544_c0_g1_i1.p1 TRINITY_DN1544_c0_g1~~TRINITY_DN1544_c0_g1_i1.p1  ORF type:complete len:481 (-),score=109.74 TRINITY_DN1544_c0_g1_i1:146-1513(-)